MKNVLHNYGSGTLAERRAEMEYSWPVTMRCKLIVVAVTPCKWCWLFCSACTRFLIGSQGKSCLQMVVVTKLADTADDAIRLFCSLDSIAGAFVVSSLKHCITESLVASQQYAYIRQDMWVIKATPTLVGGAFIFYLWTFLATHAPS